MNFIRGIHEHYVVDVDGQHFDGNQTLMCIANGRYYGGSFNPVPDAEPDDGLLDVLLVRDVSRATMLRVIGKYKAGTMPSCRSSSATSAAGGCTSAATAKARSISTVSS